MFFNKYELQDMLDENGLYPLYFDDYVPNHYDPDEEIFTKLDYAKYIHPLINASNGELPFYINPWEYYKKQNYKHNQYMMHEYNKSLKFVMLNCDKEASKLYNKLLTNKRALQVFLYLISIKGFDNICEVSQNKVAKALNIAKSTTHEAFKFLYKNNIICKIDKSIIENRNFNNENLKYVYVLSFKLVWSGHQTWKKDIYYHLPKEMRRPDKFKRFVTLDAHNLTFRFLINLGNESLSSLCVLFSLCLSMRRNNKHKIKQKSIAKKLKVSIPTIKRAVKVLKEKQILNIEKESIFNLYNINSTIMWKNNFTRNFEIDVTGVLEQKQKRHKRCIKEIAIHLLVLSPNNEEIKRRYNLY